MLYAHNCGTFFDYNHIELYRKNPKIWDALLNDDVKGFLMLLLESIEQNISENIDLADLIKKVIPENTVVSDICDKEFFKLYPSVCRLILRNKNIEALDKMTEILFSGNELNCPEDFLNVYIKLAALENHVEAFLFGNIQKAYLFIDENRKDEAKRIVDDLVEMGAGDLEDVIEITQKLKFTE